MLRIAIVTAVLLCAPAVAQRAQPPPTSPGDQKIVWRRDACREYARAKWRVFFLGHATLFAALAVFGFTGASAAMRRAIGARVGSVMLADVLYFVAALVLLGVVLAPWSYYGGFVLEHRFGLSNQTSGAWAVESLKSFGVFVAVLAPVLLLFYALLRRSPDRWWMWFSAAMVPVIIFLVVVAPVAIDPLFNRFRPLPDGPLKQRLLQMASEQGVAADDVLEADRSKQTSKANAYVTGLWGTKRIVLWDTLLQRFTPREIEAIMAHEMGHYVKRHVWWGVGIAVLTVLVLSAIVHRWAPLIVALCVKTGIVRVQEAASLPVIAALFLLLLLAASPLTSAASRHMERTADRFALEVTGDGAAAASSFEKLAAINMSDPEPSKALVFWFYSHPPIADRIREAEEYARKHPSAARAKEHTE